MTVTPQGQIFLCKTQLENDYKNQLTFANATAQLSYFNSTIQHTYSNYTYIKKDNSVKLGVNIDSIIDCNYLFYKNTGFTSKYYFCFITNMTYVNENCTLVTFETDCFQTWLFQISYKPCFVVREHVNDDTIGLHTMPENVETGPYVCNSHTVDGNLDTLCYVLLSTEWEPGSTHSDKPVAVNICGSLYTGIAYASTNLAAFSQILQDFSSSSSFSSNPVYAVYAIPSRCITLGSSAEYNGQASPSTYTLDFLKTNTIDGYSPANNKLLTFPFQYLTMSNNNGSSLTLHFERFSGNKCEFLVSGVPTIGGSIKIVPTNYDGGNYTQELGLIAGKYPTFNWSEDAYTNWLTQNGVNLALGVTSDAMSIAAAPRTGGASAISGAFGIANTIASVYQHSLEPNAARGSVNAGDINIASNNNGFHFYKMSIKQEYARVIDKYFSMFGYKVNSVKIPNITGRTNWNYVQTIDCTFDGDIPQMHLSVIKNMFNSGVTLWHNPSTMLDYSQSNSIV